MDNRLLVQNIVRSKMHVLDISTFFGMLLQHVTFAIDTQCPTACTDGQRIYFGPDFCDGMPVEELSVVLLHEIMHIVLGHCFRAAGYNPLLYNIAADIVVNSTILHTLGLDITVKGEELMHIAPDGKEGYLYTAEDIYNMLLDSLPKASPNGKRSDSQGGGGAGEGGGAPTQGQDDKKGQNGQGGKEKKASEARENDKGNGARQPDGHGPIDSAQNGADQPEYDTSAYDNGRLDDHSTWGNMGPAEKAEWQGHIVDACRSAAEQGKHAGAGAEMAKRLLKELTTPTINWRLLLQNFIQTEVHDYSFMPPDRRYTDFFLPDFNEPDDVVSDLWIVMDTSGSISPHDMARAFSEIKGGIDQFGGKLRAKLSFFDCAVSEPKEFDSVEELLRICPLGGGGTSFHAVFDYYRKHLHDKNEVTGIIIFTDGYATFPREDAAMGTPVFWLINNELVTPPWGVVARYLKE